MEIVTGITVFLAMVIMHRYGVLAGRRQLFMFPPEPTPKADTTNVVATSCDVHIRFTYIKPIPVEDARKLMADVCDGLPSFLYDRISVFEPSDPRCELCSEGSFGKYTVECNFNTKRLHPKEGK